MSLLRKDLITGLVYDALRHMSTPDAVARVLTVARGLARLRTAVTLDTEVPRLKAELCWWLLRLASTPRLAFCLRDALVRVERPSPALSRYASTTAGKRPSQRLPRKA